MRIRLAMSGTRMLAAAIVAAAMGLAGTDTTLAEERRMERTVTVTATGTVSVKPDQAHISTGVTTEADTARQALTLNTERMVKVVAGLKAAGIAAEDVQTAGFAVHPRYVNPREGRAPSISGYQVTNELRILVRDIGRLGEILDQLVSLGANQIVSLTFDVAAAETARDEARRQAIANAHRRASLYAAAAGAKVGHVLVISEDSFDPAPRGIGMARAAMAEAVPIEEGRQLLEARVSVTYALE